jgi:5-methylcytosine-specific restriction endonuclease McrA
MKTCRNCGVHKTLDLFPKQKQNKDGHHSYCKQCRSAYDKARYNPEKRNKEYVQNLASERQARREYYKDNKEAYYARKAKRRASLLNRTPLWLSEADLKQISEIYNRCSLLNKQGTVKHEVDHIVPLQGETVSGLHVPWNLQIIPMLENRSKGNRF